MTECKDVKQALLTGQRPEAVDAHIAECEPCAELARDHAELARALEAEMNEAPSGEPDRDFERLSMMLEGDADAAGWLKSRPTWMRFLLAAIVVGLATLFGLLFMRRPDLDVYPQLRMAVTIAIFSTALLVSLGYSLRPVHKSALPPWATAAAVVGALAISFALAVVPTHYTPDKSFLPEGAAWMHALRCLYFGALLGLPVYVVSRLLDRTRDPDHAFLAAGAAGLTGQLVLFLHCPINEPSHLLSGHASVAVLFLMLVFGIMKAEQRIRSKVKRTA